MFIEKFSISLLLGKIPLVVDLGLTLSFWRVERLPHCLPHAPVLMRVRELLGSYSCPACSFPLASGSLAMMCLDLVFLYLSFLMAAKLTGFIDWWCFKNKIWEVLCHCIFKYLSAHNKSFLNFFIGTPITHKLAHLIVLYLPLLNLFYFCYKNWVASIYCIY